MRAMGAQSSSTATLTYGLYIGTAGNTTDTVVSTSTATVAASVGSFFEGIITVRTAAGNGTGIGCVYASLGTVHFPSVNTTTCTVDSTQSNQVSFGVKPSQGTHTFQVAFISMAGA
jgi:hypothetical protein